MQGTRTGQHTSALIWALATLPAILGAAILFDARPGINWGLWVASASGAVIAARWRSGPGVEKPVPILLAWATVLAFALAITDNAFVRFLVIVSDAMLLGLAVIVTGTTRWSSLSAGLLPAVPLLAPYRVGLGALREAASVPARISSTRARPVVKGLLLTIPVVVALIALLSHADPVIAWSVNRVADYLPLWSLSGRALFFLFLLTLTLGASSVSARQRESRLPAYPPLGGPGTIGFTEQRIILASVGAILWLFVLLQVSYLFHSPPAAIGSGVTFADYARKGFAQLSAAATLVAAVILLLEATRPGAADALHRRSLIRLETALLMAVELILFSAFRKVALYEQAYGFTTARLFAQAYMAVIGLALVALWLEIRRGSIGIDFGRRVSVIALGVFTVLAYWNYEAWIVNRNIDRSLRTGKFDADYALHLSRDVVPTLVARRNELPAPERAKVESWLGCASPPVTRQWFELNRSVQAADLARRNAALPPCTNPDRQRQPVSADSTGPRRQP